MERLLSEIRQNVRVGEKVFLFNEIEIHICIYYGVTWQLKRDSTDDSEKSRLKGPESTSELEAVYEATSNRH
jgi:hypothetical protein